MKRIAQKAGAVQGRDCATRTRCLSRRLSGSAAADNLAAREVPVQETSHADNIPSRCSEFPIMSAVLTYTKT